MKVVVDKQLCSYIVNRHKKIQTNATNNIISQKEIMNVEAIKKLYYELGKISEKCLYASDSQYQTLNPCTIGYINIDLSMLNP